MQLDYEEYEDFMLDLETLSTEPGAVVLAIGGVLFDRKAKALGPAIHVRLTLEDQLARGMEVSEGTLLWWFEQSDEARAAAVADQMNTASALMGVAEFLTYGEGGVNKNMKVWGNGAGFDNPILTALYRRFGMEPPWKFWNDRCFRTLKNEHPQGRELEPEFDGERHNAYHDARHQAKWAINMYWGEKVEVSDYTTDEPDAEDAADEDPMHVRDLDGEEE